MRFFGKYCIVELINLKGIGKKRLSQLNNEGIFSIEDLINYFPKKFYNFENIEGYDEDGQNRLLLCKIVAEPKTVRFKKTSYAISKVEDSFGNIFSAVWYNQTYIKSVLHLNNEYYLYGRNSPKKTKTFVVALTRKKENIKEKYLPIYKKIGSFGSQNIANLIEQCFDYANFDSVIDGRIENEFGLFGLKKAYINVHKPTNIDDFEKSKIRIDIEKLVPLAVKNLLQKTQILLDNGKKYANLIGLYNDFAKILPFILTDEQKSVVNDIIDDLESKKTMNRLVQGEVGSGKTVVALFALYAAVKNGYQTAMIAPTEILAKQHYEKIKKLFFGQDIKIAYLSGKMSARDKRELCRQIKLGIVDIVIGTHSVISESVEFKNLGLAVIDEQHRFGVAQRAKMSAKGDNVDILLLSATPIPRTMAIVLYGDLNLSIIRNCPFKKEISTNIVPKNKQLDMWKYIKEKTKYGSRVFVVCANIGDDEEDGSLSATNVHKKLEKFFGEENVALIHGKQSKEQIEKTMERFSSGQVSVLVSTTVVEVGVDVPEADIMVIVSPDKFGLATLHQLRGRVGRSGKESYCFCLANELGFSAIERIKFFRDHDSGFDIAEYDYASRGSGDIYGTRQHGIASNFAVNLANYDLARKIALKVLEDAELKEKALAIAEQTYAKLCNEIVMN